MRFGFAFIGMAIAALSMERATFPAANDCIPIDGVFNTLKYHSFAGNGATRVKKTNKLRYSHNAKIKRRKK